MEFDFSQHTEVTDLNSVPEDFRGLYAETEEGSGQFKLASDNPGVKSAVAAVTRLNQALKASRAEAKAAKGQKIDLSPLADFGDTPEAIAEGVNAKLAELNDSLKKKGGEDLQRQVEKIKHDLAQAHAKEIQGRDARVEALTGQLHNLLVTNEATSALSEAGVIDADLAIPFVTKQVKVAEQDGKFTVSVTDDAGDVRYSGVTGAPMTIKELVAEMKGKEKFGPLFKSEAPSGGGTPPGSQPKPGQFGKDTSQLSAIDKISQGIAKGQARQARRRQA